jgi:hypothetical protein
MQTVTTTDGPPQTITVNQTGFNCRFHPTNWWHEVGCPHMEWTKEQLQAALASQKEQTQGIVKLWSEQFTASINRREELHAEVLKQVRAALRIGNDEELVPTCEKRMLQVDTLTDMLTDAERIGKEQYQRAQSLQLSLLEEMIKRGNLEERLKRIGKRKT